MLEPIEETDLNLKSKFSEGGLAKSANAEGANGLENKSEATAAPESIPMSEKLEKKEGSVEKEATYERILSKVKNPVDVIHNNVSNDARLANSQIDYESKVTHLVQIAETKGVAHAVKVAQHLEDNYLLDELHDRLLADDLHDALIRKGLITEI